MKKLLKDNAIFCVFLFSQTILFFFAMQNDSIIGNNYDITQALFYHFLIIVLVAVGYSTKKIIVFSYSIKGSDIGIPRFRPGFFTFALALTLIGLTTSILTVGSIVSPQEYLAQLISRDSGIADIRQQSGDGGLGGIFKMLNYAPLAIYLITSAYINFLTFDGGELKKLKKINTIALIASLIKVLFSLDRLTILAVLLVQIYTNVFKEKFSLKFLLVILGVVAVGVFITSSRMSDSGFFEFLVIYCKLSLVNFQMVIAHQTDFSYGFQTFLSPLSFIGKFFGLENNMVAPNDFVWNPAQYFNSYLYMDFSFYSLALYPILGYLINYVELKKQNGSRFYTSFYFICMFTLATFITVPFIRGMEFWLLIVICILASRFLSFEVISEPISDDHENNLR